MTRTQLFTSQYVTLSVTLPPLSYSLQEKFGYWHNCKKSRKRKLRLHVSVLLKPFYTSSIVLIAQNRIQ